MMQERSDFYVYLHRRVTDGRVFYVGKGSGPRAWVWNNRNPYWVNTKRKHGLEVEIALCDLTEANAFSEEKRLIEELRALGEPLTNMTDGGEGMSGYVYTDEHRAAISAASKGRVRSTEAIERWRQARAGWKHSDDTRAKLSEILSGRVMGPPTEETRAKISSSNTGKKHSAETRAKISKNRSGIPAALEHVMSRVKSRMESGYTHSEETKKKIGAANALALKGRKLAPHVLNMLIDMHTKKEPILCVQTGQVFDTAVDAQKWCVDQGFVHAKGGRIRRVCRGYGKSAYGYEWRFANEEKEYSSF